MVAKSTHLIILALLLAFQIRGITAAEDDDVQDDEPAQISELDFHVSKSTILVVIPFGFQDFRSFSEGTLKRSLERIKVSGEDSSFYLDIEL